MYSIRDEKEFLYLIIMRFKNINFYYFEHAVGIRKVNIDKIMIYNKVSFGTKEFKYFIQYKDDKKVKSLCIILPKMNGYLKKFDGTHYMSFPVKDNEFLKKYNKVWNKICNIIQIGFNSESVNYKKKLKNKNKK